MAEDSFDRLILTSGTPIAALVYVTLPLIGLWWVIFDPEMFDGLGQRLLVGACYGMFVAAIWWLFPRTTFAMDRESDIAVVSELRIGRRLINAYPISEIERVAVLNISHGKNVRGLAPHLMINGRRVPIIRRSVSSERAYRVQHLIENWLTRAH